MKLPVVQIESAALPPLYDGWVRSLLGGAIPAETNATCDDCAMCDTVVAPRGSAEWYNPATKCCTYLPKISNFLVGRILLDNDPGIVSNRASVELRLEGSTVNPLGISVPSEYTTLYTSFRNRFGHSSEMLCPHYIADGGRCGIWRHRNSVCATWFCKHVRGSISEKFWTLLLHLLQSVEANLAIWCINELHPNSKTLWEQLAGQRDGANTRLPTEDGSNDVPQDSPRYKAIWGDWHGKEREFFKRCAEIVSPLEWHQVLALCGQQTRMLASAVTAAYRDLFDQTLPAALHVGSIHIVKLGEQNVRLSAYQSADPVEIPRELFDVLNEFEGRSTAEALRVIEDRHGLSLDQELVRGLVDFEVLRSAD